MDRLKRDEIFCEVYLATMDPKRAGTAAGVADGFALLKSKGVQRRLSAMREAAQIHREDVLARLAQLAFGRANDAVKLALHSGEAEPEQLDLSAVAEFRVTDKGGVEVKLVDRVRALETLYGLLGEEHSGAEELYEALRGDIDEGGWENG